MANNAEFPETPAGPAPTSNLRDAKPGSAAASLSAKDACPPASEDAGPPASEMVEIAEIVNQHHAAVYRYAFRLCGGSHDAEDLTQQTFLIAREKIDQLRSAEAARGWLFTVVRNCFLKELRQRRPALIANLSGALEDRSPASTKDAVDREGLEMALAKLPDEFRLPLLMFYFEELSYREIAGALGVPVGTVMSRLARAKAHLRHYWLEREDEKPRRPAQREPSPRFAATPHLAP